MIESHYAITGISLACGRSVGALYYYIGSEEQLLAAIHDRVMGEVMDGATRT
jgi:AcrR family transcriptional regulator